MAARAIIGLVALATMLVACDVEIKGDPMPTSPPTVATPVTASATSTGEAVPAGFTPSAGSFSSTTTGWVLGFTKCTDGACAALIRTVDAGSNWSLVSRPPVAAPSIKEEFPASGVSDVRFSDAKNGWIFGPDLWSTHDGGKSWTKQNLSALAPDVRVAGLETAKGLVTFVTEQHGDFLFASGPTDHDAWTATPEPSIGGGPVPRGQIMLRGTDGWAVVNNRVVAGGLHLVNGAWKVWEPPCQELNAVVALIASSSGDQLIAKCTESGFGDPFGSQFYVSTDSGKTFAPSGPRYDKSICAMLGSPRPDVVLCGVTGGTALLQISTGTLTPVTGVPADEWVGMGFTTATQGFGFGADAAGRATMYMTRDAGLTWTAVAFGSPK